ncbi:MAG: NAD(P)-dependent oxidoreductase [Micropruina sp.]|uniref:NAD(P)-dependent oxidoreductase n=1 Tax=Micropruina sp. TaxID=2737536 RepID=UPI0039E7246A
MSDGAASGFRVGISRDFLDQAGRNVWGDIGLDRLDREGVEYRYLDEDVDELRPSDIAGFDAVLFARPAVTAATFAGPGPHPKLLARFGVGYDTVDLDACSAHGVLVTITPDGARRAVATAALTMILAGLHHVVVKDRIVRSGDWAPRTRFMGRGLTGKTVGFIGLGNTATDLLTLLEPFRCRVVASSPGIDPDWAREHGVTMTDAAGVFEASDVIVIMAALNAQTHHLVNADLLARVRPGALLVNVARGPIVDEAALVEALRSGNLGGAALDVFETEPLASDSPLIGMDNVVLAPHCLAWTDEMSLGNGGSAVQAILDVRDGRTPKYVVKPR